MKLTYQGKNYDFPDNASIEQINKFLGSSINQQFQQQNNKPDLGILPDVGAGLIHGLQSIVPQATNIIPKSMSAITPFLRRSEPIAPFIQKGNQNIDPYKLMGTEEQPFYTGKGAAQTAGELLLLAPALTKAPEAINMIRQGYQDIKPVLNKITAPARNAINYLRPGKTAANFMENLSGVPADVNAQRIGETLNTAYEGQKSDALKHKENVMNQEGKSNITELPGFNTQKLISLSDLDMGEVKPEQIKSLNKAVGDYHFDEDFNRFLDRYENILGTDLNENKIDKLEEMLGRKKLKYENNEDIFSGYDKRLKNIHDQFMKDKTLKNADRLIIELNDRIFKYHDIDSKIGLHPTDSEKMKDLIDVKKDLISDMDSHMEGKPNDVRQEYKTFRTKWAKNVEPYESTSKLSSISRGTTEGNTPQEYRGIFSHPTKEVKKILDDLPQEGKNYILYNELAQKNPKNGKELFNALNELENQKGYSTYITPEIKEFKNRLKNQLLASNILKYGGGGALALTALGTAGLPLYKLGRNVLSK